MLLTILVMRLTQRFTHLNFNFARDLTPVAAIGRTRAPTTGLNGHFGKSFHLPGQPNPGLGAVAKDFSGGRNPTRVVHRSRVNEC